MDAVFAGMIARGKPFCLHVSATTEKIIPETVEGMRAFDLCVIAAGHCTGWRAITALANAFGDGKLVPLSVGKRFSF